MSEPYVTDEAESLEPVFDREGRSASRPLDSAAGPVPARHGRPCRCSRAFITGRASAASASTTSQLFEFHSIAWRAATVFFAVIDLVAAVGLWLAAAWGAVIWLMSVASMMALEIFFPQVFGGGIMIGIAEGGLLALYLWLALKSAQEHPQ